MKNLTLFILISFFASHLTAQKDYGYEWSIDTVTFEEPCFYLKTDTSAINIWQIGEPQKTFFNSSFSLPNAVVTDTLNNYPVNKYSYFDLIIDDNSFPYFYNQMCFEIKHKIDTDTLKDGGYITVSFDKGQSWNIIINEQLIDYCIVPNPWDDSFINKNIYSQEDTLFNGEYGFSGKSDWTETRFTWSYCPVKNNTEVADTVIIRFNFISDNIDNEKEGWMIDDIRLFNADLGSNVENLNKQKHSAFQTNPVKDKSIIIFDKIYKNTDVYLYDFQGKELRKTTVKNKKEYLFTANNLPVGMYFLKIIFDNKISETYKIIIL